MTEMITRRPTRRSDGKKTVDALLDAGMAIWSEEGLPGITMNAVAERAQKTRGTVYHHFSDRADLIVALQKHVDERLSAMFDISKAPSRDDYLVVAGIMVDSPELLRSCFHRMLSHDAGTDPLIATARDHYREVAARDWLQPGMNPDHAAMISIAMWLAASLAVDLKQTPEERRAEARAFAATFRSVMEKAVIRPESERP